MVKASLIVNTARRLRSVGLRALLFLLLAIVTARLVWVVSRTEIGWELLGCQWQDATVGRFGLRPTSIDAMLPAEQAAYWLPEVQRILDESPPSAQLAMGAAWVLDSPNRRWEGHSPPRGKYTGIPPRFGMRPTPEALEQADEQFERSCHQRSLALASLATRREPHNRSWWRLRAVLQMDPQTIKPRSPDWPDVLDECARHDPNNAFYDYLAAMFLWNESGAVDLSFSSNWPKGGPTVTARDQALFEQGLQRWNSGLAGESVILDGPVWPATAELLSHSRLRRIDRLTVIWGHEARSRVWLPPRGLFQNLRRWQAYRAKHAREMGDPASELAILRETLRFYDQISSEKTMAVELALNCYNERCALFADLMALVQKHSGLISKDQIEQLIANEQSYRFDAVATQRALVAVFATAQRGRPFLPMVPAVFASFALLAAMFLFVLAFLAWALGRLLDRGPPVMPRFRLLPNLIAWLLACALTSLYLGAIPARVFSLQTGTRVSTIVVYTIVLLVPLFWAIGRTFQFLRKRRFRFSLVWLLGAMAACAFLAALWANLQPMVWQIAQGLPQQQWRMRGGWIGTDVDLTRFTDGSSASLLAQWLARGGPYFSVIGGMLILMIWLYPRSLVDSGERFLERVTEPRNECPCTGNLESKTRFWDMLLRGSLRESREHWALIMRELARSGALAATCLVIGYLWWAAGFVRIEDYGYSETMRAIRTPDAVAGQLDQARTQLLASPQATADIRQAVAAEIQADRLSLDE